MDRYYVTNGVMDLMKGSRNFRGFVSTSFERFIHNDWGNVSENDWTLNDADKENALAAYKQEGMPKIWIKRDVNKITVLFPEEY